MKNYWRKIKELGKSPEELLQMYVREHNRCYRKISELAIMLNNGHHPKHDIMKYHDFFVENVLPTDSVLDLGCGDGSLTRDVAGKARQVIGIDIKEANIEKAKANCQKENADFIVGDATTYEFTDKFDKIILSNVLEHIENRIEFLDSLRKLSDTILLRVPMLDRDWLVVYKKQKDLEYRLDKTHFIEYTLESLNQELGSAGWQLKNHTRQFGELWGVVEAKNNTNH